MTGDGRKITARQARDRLGVKRGADAAALTAAFREAARRTHPDAGGDAAAFRAVLEAYRFLKHEPDDSGIAFMPIPAPVRAAALEISLQVALFGGEALVSTADGRRLKLKLEAGLRPGQTVRAGDESFQVEIRAEGVTVRGDDIWLSHAVDEAVLTDGGRLMLDTPCGRRSLWINRKTAARRLVRLPGDGLPAHGVHRQGDLFVRLIQGQAPAASPAQILLRRFAAAWAA